MAGVWIPAFAGMTDGVVCFHMALAAQNDSPSPNPLPLGEGFLGAGANARRQGLKPGGNWRIIAQTISLMG